MWCSNSTTRITLTICPVSCFAVDPVYTGVDFEIVIPCQHGLFFILVLAYQAYHIFRNGLNERALF